MNYEDCDYNVRFCDIFGGTTLKEDSAVSGLLVKYNGGWNGDKLIKTLPTQPVNGRVNRPINAERCVTNQSSFLSTSHHLYFFSLTS